MRFGTSTDCVAGQKIEEMETSKYIIDMILKCACDMKNALQGTSFAELCGINTLKSVRGRRGD